jgi:hypothetical protein
LAGKTGLSRKTMQTGILEQESKNQKKYYRPGGMFHDDNL